MLRVNTVWTTGPGSPYYNSLYFGGTTSGEAAAAIDAVRDFWDDLEPLTVDNLIWVVQPEVEVVNENTGQVTQVFLDTDSTHQGTSAGDPISWASQVLIRWRSNVYVAGREVRGRTYWPGINEGLCTDGVLTGTGQSAFLTAANTFLASGNTAAAGGHGIYSIKNAQFHPTAAASVWNQFAVMRSRRPT